MNQDIIYSPFEQNLIMKDKCLLWTLIICFACSCVSLEDSSNQLIHETKNGNEKKAVLFMKHGGATVDNSLQVSIIRVQDKIENNATGNIFICDDSSGSVGNADVKLWWKHPDTLEITYKKRLRVFKNEQQLLRASVTYKQVE